MQTPATLLFDNQIDSKGSLFKNRLELSTLLLKTNGSKYYEDSLEPSVFNGKINSLQSYLSHVIAGTGIRKITPEFKQSLSYLIKERVKKIESAEQIILNLFESIDYYNSIKNSITHKNVHNKVIQIFQEMLHAQKNANYVAIFTNRPIELEADPDKYSLQIRQVTIDSILNYVTEKGIIKYRFNFPSQNIAILFWRKLSYLLVKELHIENSDKIASIDSFLKNREIDTSKIKKTPNEELNLKYKINEFLKIVNDEAWIQVIYLPEPVFVIPHIIFDPNEIKKSEGFIYMTSDSENFQIHKYQHFELLNWRERVWDLIKLNRKSVPIKFSDALEDNIDDFKLNLK